MSKALVIHELVTLFGADGAIDLAAMAALATDHLRQGAGELIVAGAAGEGATIEPIERVRIATAVASAGLPVWISLESLPGDAQILLAGLTSQRVLLAPPLYWDLPAGALNDHYRAVASAARGAVMVLHDPARRVSFQAAVEAALTIPECTGMIDLAGGVPEMSEAIRLLDAAGRRYFGTLPGAPIVAALGGAGFVTAAAPAAPGAVRQAAQRDDANLIALAALLGRRPAWIKAAAGFAGADLGTARAPFLPPHGRDFEILAEKVRALHAKDEERSATTGDNHAVDQRVA